MDVEGAVGYDIAGWDGLVCERQECLIRLSFPKYFARMKAKALTIMQGRLHHVDDLSLVQTGNGFLD